MPRTSLCQDKNKHSNDVLMAEISRGMAMRGRKRIEYAGIAGIAEATAYTRNRNPGEFRLTELRRLFEKLGTSNDVILAVFGREDKR